MSDALGVLVLMGPTASGKSALAVELAQQFGAEIIGADSRQIYRGMPIGTAAPTSAQRAAAAHHLVEFLDPYERYSAARFAQDASAVITAIHARRRRAIVVGGTGFYIRALTGDVSLAPQYDAGLRERLAREARIHDAPFLHEWLSVRDADRARALPQRDTYRVLRALEIALTPPQRDACRRTLTADNVRFFKVALAVPLPELDARVERRTDEMLGAGLLEEAERIGTRAAAASAVGYPQALAYLRGWMTQTELRSVLSRATRRYARRQYTWLRSEPKTVWLKPGDVAEAARENLGWL